MPKYKWSFDTIIEKLNLIEKLISVEKDNDRLCLLQRDYYNLQKIIEDEYNNEHHNKTKLLDSYNDIKETLQPIEFLWEDFKIFDNTINKKLKIPKLKRNSLSKEDLLTITHDFYKSLNKYFYGNFMKNFYRRNDHIIFQSYSNNICGETIGIPSLKESFIRIYRDYNNEDILTTVHEYSHATSLSINPNHLTESKTLYTEIDTIFMELVASEYISKLFKDNSSTIFNASKLNEYSSYAEDISIMIKTIESEKYAENGYSNNKTLKKIAAEVLDFVPDIIDDVIGEPNLDNIIYLTSYMFALELFNLYNEDKEKALYILKRIILLENMNELEYYNNILKLGINPNFILQEHYKEMEKETLKLRRKK